ncbi:Panacea domain-containing protein [Candidatus Palauibacter sp.]|uniref:Panacea domain-containing protein n=1 Tax=Candidatus Palauibacter sp. TaxID=3101350 RepID=UPI003C6FA71C
MHEAIKLLYLVDRRSLLERGVPVTYGRYVSMSHGPVLSETLDLINYGSGPSEESYWEDPCRRGFALRGFAEGRLSR